MVELEHSRALLQEFGLTTAAELLDASLEKASKAESSYVSFLQDLLSLEQSERARRSEETRMKLSRLPSRKTLEEFDFSYQPSIDPKQVKDLAALTFAARKENVIFLGPPGVGKTHLSVALGLEGIRCGLTVYYTTLSKLIDDLVRASEQNRLGKRWRVYLRPNILIVDEIGYRKLSCSEAELFFRLVSERYETGSMILTSNKNFGEWGELMSDPVIATAILDRLLHHAQVVNIRGSSYRLKDRLKTGVAVAPPADVPALDPPASE
jgi:DNA replication protein DnaC